MLEIQRLHVRQRHQCIRLLHLHQPERQRQHRYRPDEALQNLNMPTVVLARGCVRGGDADPGPQPRWGHGLCAGRGHVCLAGDGLGLGDAVGVGRRLPAPREQWRRNDLAHPGLAGGGVRQPTGVVTRYGGLGATKLVARRNLPHRRLLCRCRRCCAVQAIPMRSNQGRSAAAAGGASVGGRQAHGPTAPHCLTGKNETGQEGRPARECHRVAVQHACVRRQTGAYACTRSAACRRASGVRRGVQALPLRSNQGRSAAAAGGASVHGQAHGQTAPHCLTGKNEWT